MSVCPATKKWKQLASGSLRGEAADSLREHLEGCASCREVYDRQFTDPPPHTEQTVPFHTTDLRRLEMDAHGSSVEAHADPSPSAVNDSIPGYQILGEIHRGGQGVVYQAIQKTTRRRVAIKVMREGPFAGKRDKARFEREVQIMAQLRHPNIVPIHDSGIASGNFYYVMDYISGQPLDAYMESRDYSIQETLQLFTRIAQAVNAAHLRGVIHRDLKPGNIRIDPEGEPHILDFGLAKMATGSVTEDSQPQVMTMTGQFIGSMPWSSPEQAEGIPSKIDVRTDVYALGVILYQMLTRRFPYDIAGSMRDVLDNIIRVEPVRPSSMRKEIDDEVETIILKSLAKDRDRRYQSAGELSNDVLRYLKGEPIEAKRDSLSYMLRKQLRRYRWPAGIAASFILLLILSATLSATLWRKAVADRDRAVSAEILAKEAEAQAKQAEEAADAQRKLAEQEEQRARLSAHYAQAQYQLAMGDLREAYRHVSAAMDQEVRLEYGNLLSQIVAASRKHWNLVGCFPISDEPVERAVILSGNPLHLVLATDRALIAYQLLDGTQVARIPKDTPINHMVDAGRGRLALARQDGKVELYALPDLKLQGKFNSGADVSTLRAGGAQDLLAILNDEGDVHVLSLPELAVLQRRRFFTQLVQYSYAFPDIDVSPDGESIAVFAGLNLPVRLWKWRQDEMRRFPLKDARALSYVDNETLVVSLMPGWHYYFAEDRDGQLHWDNLVRADNDVRRPDVIATRKSSYELEDLKATRLENLAYLFDQSTMNVISDQRGSVMTSSYASMWPHERVGASLAAFHSEAQMLVLTCGPKAVVFQARLFSSSSSSETPSNLQRSIPTHGWGITMSRKGTYSCVRRQGVMDLHCLTPDGQVKKIMLETPEIQGDPWGIASREDGQLICVLWQEYEKTFDRPGKGKTALFYNLEGPTLSKPVRIARRFPLDRHQGVRARSNRLWCLTPDASTLFHADAVKGATGYDSTTGAEQYRLEYGNSYWISPDGSLYVVGDYMHEQPVRVYDVATGSLLFETPQVGNLCTAAVSPNNRHLYVGWETGIVEVYSIEEKAILRRFPSSASPIAISPDARRYIGFKRRVNPLGSHVLADGATGEFVLFLAEDTHILTKARYSLDGRTIAIPSMNALTIIEQMTLDDARQSLERIEPVQRGSGWSVHAIR